MPTLMTDEFSASAPGTFLWYDLETYGKDYTSSPIVQFGAIRTNAELEVLDKISLLCSPPPDLPIDPESVIIHNISPITAQHKGMCEADFARKIFTEFTKPNSCNLGYNSLAFDNHFIRFLFFRNLLPPYWHEYKEDCSKWDLLNFTRLISVIEPTAINIPLINNKPSFVLSGIAAKNGLPIQKLHDALSDAETLLGLAKQIKQQTPSLYNYCFNSRKKTQAESIVKANECLLYFSSQFGGSLIYPLIKHPQNNNSYICFDLGCSPLDLLQMTTEEAHIGHFKTTSLTKINGNDKTPDPISGNISPCGLKNIRLNLCPALYPWDNNWGDTKIDEIFFKLQLNREVARTHLKQIKNNKDSLINKVIEIYNINYKPAWEKVKKEQVVYTEQTLYNGDFINNKDSAFGQKIHSIGEEEIKNICGEDMLFEDVRLNKMLTHFKGRNFPNSLSLKEKVKWNNHCANFNDSWLPKIINKVRELIATKQLDPPESETLVETLKYLEGLQK